MGRPAMTEDQRVMAVALLANAIRKDEQGRARRNARPPDTPLLPTATGRHQRDGASQYVRAMRDLLAVLFADGYAGADACYETARAQAVGDAAGSGER